MSLVTDYILIRAASWEPPTHLLSSYLVAYLWHQAELYQSFARTLNSSLGTDHQTIAASADGF